MDQVFAKATTLAHRGLQGMGRAGQAGFYFLGACKETQNQIQVRKMPTRAAQSPCLIQVIKDVTTHQTRVQAGSPVISSDARRMSLVGAELER